MGHPAPPTPARLRRLAEELDEVGLARPAAGHDLLLREVDLALRPPSTSGRSLRTDGPDEWAVFDRPAGSERDLVVSEDGPVSVLRAGVLVGASASES